MRTLFLLDTEVFRCLFRFLFRKTPAPDDRFTVRNVCLTRLSAGRAGEFCRLGGLRLFVAALCAAFTAVFAYLSDLAVNFVHAARTLAILVVEN